MSKAWMFLFTKILFDVLLVNISFILGYLIKFGLVNPLTAPVSIYLKALIFVTMLWLIIFNLAGLYKFQPEKINRVDNIFSVSFGVFSSAFFTYIIVVFLYREAFYAKEIVIYSSLFALLLINLSRYIIWLIHKRLEV